MRLIFITSNPHEAYLAQSAGVDRIMVDLEINGKFVRQGHLNTVISGHSMSDVTSLRGILDQSSLMVRLNPLHDGTLSELDEIIDRGADRVMLPMFKHPSEVEHFMDLVAGRIPVTLLVETPQALVRLERIIQLQCLCSDVDDIHFGLNDLHLGLGLDFMFEILSEGVLKQAVNILRNAGWRYGIGGVARCGHGALPAELILDEHIRLGSSRVFLSRDFRTIFQSSAPYQDQLKEFKWAVRNIRKTLVDHRHSSSSSRDLKRISRSIANDFIVADTDCSANSIRKTGS